MTGAIEIAKRCGIMYYMTPDNTCEMHGTDRQIEEFAEVIRAAEREEGFTLDMIEAIYEAWHGAGIDIIGGSWGKFVSMLPMRSNA